MAVQTPTIIDLSQISAKICAAVHFFPCGLRHPVVNTPSPKQTWRGNAGWLVGEAATKDHRNENLEARRQMRPKFGCFVCFVSALFEVVYC